MLTTIHFRFRIDSRIGMIGSLLGLALTLAACQRTKVTPNGVFAEPPRNTIKQALDSTVAALNRHDSAAYWNSLLYESREWASARAPAQELWDSSIGSKVSYNILYTREFDRTVHSPTELAHFGHAFINLRFTGRKNEQLDSLLTVLRVDTGRWLVGGWSRLTPAGDLKDVHY